MVPYHIHEVPFQHFSARIHKLLASLSLDEDDNITCSMHFNLAIRNEDTTVIPDLHLELCLRHPPGARAIPFWVGECGFSSIRTEMERQLMLVANIIPEMDVAIMVSICEVHHDLPPRDHLLHSLPALSHTAFTPTVAPSAYSLDPVIVEDVTWLEIKSVTFCVLLRGTNGEFNFTERGPLYAQGVSLLPLQRIAQADLAYPILSHCFPISRWMK